MLLAYHNDPKIKAKYLRRVRAHAKADELIKGTGWEDGKGCAIGCTLHAYDHAQYPIELGIPEMLARLEDTIFEGLPNKQAKEWPARFLKAIRPGADLSRVGWQFLYWLITKSGIGAYDHPLVKDAVAQVAEVLRAPAEGRPIDASAAWSAAWSAARSAESAASAARSAASAERSAESAAWSAARSAESAARSAERSAAWSAAWSAESAAWSAESAASAASAERSAESAASAERRAESAAYTTMADQLIKLLEAA